MTSMYVYLFYILYSHSFLTYSPIFRLVSTAYNNLEKTRSTLVCLATRKKLDFKNTWNIKGYGVLKIVQHVTFGYKMKKILKFTTIVDIKELLS